MVIKNIKKIVIIFFLILSKNIFCKTYLFSQSKNLYLDMPKKEFIDLIGFPKSTYVKKESQNKKWDLICYEFENIDIYCYRAIQKINIIYLTSSIFEIYIDGLSIKCGDSKDLIEEKLGFGKFFNCDRARMEWEYYYILSDFRELQIFYNSSNVVVGILYGYQNPE